MKARRLIVLLVIAALVSLGATSTQLAARNYLATIPQATTIPMLAGTTQPIKFALGNQTNPRVACNLATYTDDDFQGNSTVRYFDFATNTEHIVPGNGLDRLADTDGQRIAFTQVEPDGDHHSSLRHCFPNNDASSRRQRLSTCDWGELDCLCAR